MRNLEKRVDDIEDQIRILQHMTRLITKEREEEFKEDGECLECAICYDKGFPYYACIRRKTVCRKCVLDLYGAVNGWPPG